MGLCMNCVRRVGARLARPSVERESQRRVSSYRVVARGASCQGQPRPPLPVASRPPRRKSDCRRHHKHKAFSAKRLLLVFPSLFLVFLLLWVELCSQCSGARVEPLRITITPTLPLSHSPPPSLLLRCYLFFSEFLCAVPWKALGVTTCM
jgi:hypothetical protein